MACKAARATVGRDPQMLVPSCRYTRSHCPAPSALPRSISKASCHVLSYKSSLQALLPGANVFSLSEHEASCNDAYRSWSPLSARGTGSPAKTTVCFRWLLPGWLAAGAHRPSSTVPTSNTKGRQKQSLPGSATVVSCG